MTWTKPEVKTYDEVELLEKMAAKAQTHEDGHQDFPVN